jgi:hypothetical protein
MAQAFSLALDSAFMLDTEVDHLSQTIEQKYVSPRPVSMFDFNCRCRWPLGLIEDEADSLAAESRW